MTTPGFACSGHNHRTAGVNGRLRAMVRALAQDVRAVSREVPELDSALRRVFRRDLKRAHQVLQESDGRWAWGGEP